MLPGMKQRYSLPPAGIHRFYFVVLIAVAAQTGQCQVFEFCLTSQATGNNMLYSKGVG